MTREVIAFADVSDAAVTMSLEVSLHLSRKVSLQLLTDSQCLFGLIFKGSQTSEK